MPIVDYSKLSKKEREARLASFRKTAAAPGYSNQVNNENTQQMNAIRNMFVQGEQEKKQGRGLVGNILGSIIDPIGRIGESIGALSAGTPSALSWTGEQAYRQDPTRFIGQRLADVGSIGLMAVPGAGMGLKGAIGLGAGIGGLGAIGGADKDTDLLEAGGMGALTGGVLGAAGYGIGKMFEKAGGKLRGNKELARKLQEPNLEKDIKIGRKGPIKTQQAKNEFLNTVTDDLGNKKEGFLDIVRSQNNGKVPDIETLVNQTEKIRTQAGRELADLISGNNKPIDLYHKIESDFVKNFPSGWKRQAQETFRKGVKIPEILGETSSITPLDAVTLQTAKTMLGKEMSPQGLSSLKPMQQELYSFLQRRLENLSPEVSRLNNIIHKVKVFESKVPELLGMSVKSYERMRVPGTPFTFGAPVETGSMLAKAKAKVGSGLEKLGKSKVPSAFENVGGFMQNPNLGKIGGLIGAQQEQPQVQDIGQMEQLEGLQGALGGNDLSTATNEQRKNLFMQLFQQYPDESPAALKTIVDMMVPENPAQTTAELNKLDTSKMAQRALSILQQDPSVAGKITNIKQGIGKFIGRPDEATTNYQFAITQYNNTIKKAQAGTAMNSQEFKMLRDMMVQPTDEPKTALFKLQQAVQTFGGF